VQSEPGRGSTFAIYLPRVEAAAVKPAAAVLLPESGSETVLLVEDEEVVRGLARTILTMHGYRVLEAREGGEALRICEGHAGSIHLLLTDVIMPGMSGRQVADRVQALRPEVRVLYMSGYTDDAVLRHGVLAAEMAFLPKPFTPEGMARKVREVLDR
jgi:CheY-like chemotaxis protein